MSTLGKIILVVTGVIIAISTYLYITNPSGTATLDPRARVFGYTFYNISSSSMAPSLAPDNLIVVETYVYSEASPQKQDIVVFRYPPNPNQSYVKRVIGTAGDVIKIANHRLWLNGIEIEEPYAEHLSSTGSKPGLWTVPNEQLFVLGDNRDNSYDSRFWGFVPVDQVVGKVAYIW